MSDGWVNKQTNKQTGIPDDVYPSKSSGDKWFDFCPIASACALNIPDHCISWGFNWASLFNIYFPVPANY